MLEFYPNQNIDDDRKKKNDIELKKELLKSKSYSMTMTFFFCETILLFIGFISLGIFGYDFSAFVDLLIKIPYFIGFLAILSTIHLCVNRKFVPFLLCIINWYLFVKIKEYLWLS